jgi:hypothetical protein
MFVMGAVGFVVMFDFAWLPLLNTLKKTEEEKRRHEEATRPIRRPAS